MTANQNEGEENSLSLQENAACWGRSSVPQSSGTRKVLKEQTHSSSFTLLLASFTLLLAYCTYRRLQGIKCCHLLVSAVSLKQTLDLPLVKRAWIQILFSLHKSC